MENQPPIFGRKIYFMKQLDIDVSSRKCVEAARIKGEQTNDHAFALELADGSISILIEGTLCSDESTWKCSPIDHLLDSSHFVTINHSIYTLIVILFQDGVNIYI